MVVTGLSWIPTLSAQSFSGTFSTYVIQREKGTPSLLQGRMKNMPCRPMEPMVSTACMGEHDTKFNEEPCTYQD